MRPVTLHARPLPAARPAAAPGPSIASLARALIAFSALVWLAAPALGFARAVTILTYAGLGIAILGLLVRGLGLLGVTMLCTLDAVSRFYVESSIIWRWNTFNYLLIGATILLAAKSRNIRNLQSILLAALVGVLGIGLISTLSSIDGIQHILGAAAFWGILVYIERGAGLRSEPWYWTAMLSGVVAGLGGFLYFLQDTGVQRQINKNALSYFFLTAVFVCGIALLHRDLKPIRRTLLVALAALNSGWTFLTGSRGSMLIASFCLLFALLQVRSTVLRLGVLGLGFVGFLLVSSRFESESGRSAARAQKLFDSSYSWSGRTSGRSDLAIAGWHLFLDNPVLGVGTGSFAQKWSRLTDLPGLSTYKFGEQQQAHSAWIKTMAENGVPGLVLLVAFVGSFAFQGFRRRSDGLLLTGVWISCVLALAFLSTEFQGKGLWFLAAAGSMHLYAPPARRAKAALRLRRVS
jgi:hypothetical protein